MHPLYYEVLLKSIDLAKIAGDEILKIYNQSFGVVYKEDESPLTQADTNANAIITKGLGDCFPDISILSEESRDDDSRYSNDYCFIVDPLDGTKEFIGKNGEFTVNIALAYKGKSVLGVVFVPTTQELYYAIENYGSYYEIGDKRICITVSDKIKELILVGSRSHQSGAMDALIEKKKNVIKEIKNIGSSLKGCLVASGKADIYYRFGLTMEWDTAAMQCIIEEAGGIFRQMDHSEMRYNRLDSLNSKGFYALNKKENLFV